jgi:hypothetical protein
MSNSLVSNITKTQQLDRIYVVEQTGNSALYSAVLANSVLLPKGSIVVLKPTSGVSTVKIVEDVPVTWANAKAITVAGKTQIAALTANATANATDLASAVALANSLKTSVNAIIAALKA